MAAIILKIELDGKTVDYTLITTDRPNTDGYFGARLFDPEMKSIGIALSSKREKCLQEVKQQIKAHTIGNIMNLYGYNIPADVKQLLMHDYVKAVPQTIL